MVRTSAVVLGRVSLLLLMMGGCGSEANDLLATAAPVAGAGSFGDAGTSVRLTARVGGDGHAVVLSDGERRSTIDLSESIGPGYVQQCAVRFDRATSGGRWVVLDVRGPSRQNPAPSFAGTAGEGCLVWLKLDADLRPINVQAVVYESSLRTVDPVGGVRQTGDGISIRADCLDRMTTVQVAFHAARPDRGFDVSTGPMN